MEPVKKTDNYVEAVAIVGNEYFFSLNRQMTPLKCVVVGVDCSKGHPLFIIDLNCDAGVGEFSPGEARLADVSPKFLYTQEAIKDRPLSLPCNAQPGQNAIFDFAGKRSGAYCRAVKFTDQGEVFYDLDVFFDKDKSLHTILPEIHAAFVTTKQEEGEDLIPGPIKERIHWLIHDAAFALSTHNIEKAQAILSQADALAHDL